MSMLLTAKEKKNFNPKNKIDQAIYADRARYLLSLSYLTLGNAGDFSGIPREVAEIQNFISYDTNVTDGVTSRKINYNKEVAIQNMTTGTDYPEFLTNLYKKIEIMEPFDTEWRWFYEWRPMDSGGFDMAIDENNVTTHRTPPGQSARYYGTSESKYRVRAAWYSTGVAISRRLLYDRDFYTIEKDLMAQKAASDRKKAEVAYTLIEAISEVAYPVGRNVAWHAPDPAGLPATDPNYTLSRDAETIVQGAIDLIEDNKNRPNVLVNADKTTFHILVPFQLVKRITAALNYTQQGYAGSPKVTGNYNFVVHSTTMLTSSADYYMGIPNGETVGGSLLEFTRYDEFNKDIFADENVAWEAYAFNIGNTEQFVRLKSE